MEYVIYNEEGKKVDILQNTTSIQWMPRYNETGTFEIHAKPTESNKEYLVIGNRIVNQSTEEIGFIKEVNQTQDDDGQEEIEARGEMDNLDQRINIKLFKISTIAMSLMQLVINNQRGLEIQMGDMPTINDKYDPPKETTWDELRTTYQEVCQEKGIGYRMMRRNKALNVLEIYKNGINEKVKFSDDLGNIIAQNYLKSIESFKNYAYVCGEGEGSERVVVGIDLTNGGPRYELYVDARNVSKTYTDANGGEQTYNDEEYQNVLMNYGLSKLLEYQETNEFEVEIKESDTLFTLNKDYFMGDVIKTESKKYGLLKYFRISGVNYIQESDSKVELVLTDYETEQSQILLKGGK